MTSSSEEMEGFETWVLLEIKKVFETWVPYELEIRNLKINLWQAHRRRWKVLRPQNQVLFIFSLLVLYQFLILTYNVQSKLRCICREKDYFCLRLLWLSNQIQQSNSAYCEILRKRTVHNDNWKYIPTKLLQVQELMLWWFGSTLRHLL